MKNIILIGYMGSGKSTVGYHLSFRLKTPLLDTDKEIEREQNCTISSIFAEQGEECFRNLETEYLKRLLESGSKCILSTGGGMPIREENQILLRELGQVIYLKASKETLYERLKGDTKRPLLQCEDPIKKIDEMLKIRDPYYRQTANLIICVDGKNMEEVLTEIQEAVEKNE